jgi:hypothetical protein
LAATQGANAGERIDTVLGRAMDVVQSSGARLFEPQIQHKLAALTSVRG